MHICKHCFRTIEPTNLGARLSGGRLGPVTPRWRHCDTRRTWCSGPPNPDWAEPLVLPEKRAL